MSGRWGRGRSAFAGPTAATRPPSARRPPLDRGPTRESGAAPPRPSAVLRHDLSFRHSGQGAAATRNRRAMALAALAEAPPSATALGPPIPHLRRAACGMTLEREERRDDSRSEWPDRERVALQVRRLSDKTNQSACWGPPSHFSRISRAIFAKFLSKFATPDQVEYPNYFNIINLKITHPLDFFETRLSIAARYLYPQRKSSIPAGGNHLSPFLQPSDADRQDPTSEQLSPTAFTYAVPPRLLNLRPLPSSFRASGARPGTHRHLQQARKGRAHASHARHITHRPWPRLRTTPPGTAPPGQSAALETV